MLKKIFVALLLLLAFRIARAQTADPQLLAEIQKIKAIDNHSHPPKLVGPGEKDDEFDALPCDPLEPGDLPVVARPENPQFLAAWKALYGYRYNDASPEHVRELLQAKQKIMQQQGDKYPSWVLDRIGIEVEFANRIAMGRGLNPQHFRWVPFDDPLLFPLSNVSMSSDTPDHKFFYSREEMLLKRYMKELGVNGMPTTLEQYTSQVVTPTLEAQKRQGAVAIKFEAAYLRSLDFGPIPGAMSPAELLSALSVNKTYSRYIAGGAPPKAEYVKLQDYLIRYIAREAGRLGLAVHFHTGFGCGTYFELSGANPVLLESLFNDPTLRKTNFVMLHGGAGPFSKLASYLMAKPNVYADFSEQTWLTSSRKLSEVLRDWLESFPEKVLFGTDLYPNTPEINWEEVGWQTSHSAREALAIALTGMMQDGEITRARALELAHMALHDNAAKLYGLSGH